MSPVVTSTRRELLGWAGGAAAAAVLFGPRAFASGEPIRAGLVLPAGSSAAARVRAGAAMGADEAQRAASLLRRDFVLETAEAATPAAAAAAAERLAASDAVAVLGGVTAAHGEAIAARVPAARFLEIRSRRELSPDEAPPGHLRVTAGYDAHARALAAALRERPEARGLESGVRLEPAPGTAVPVAWHPSLRRYGAAQLNERFQARTGRGMDEDAWYGWIAVKLALESALRGRPLGEARTDGHKGEPLEFRDGRLHQPLYVVVHDGDGPEVIGG